VNCEVKVIGAVRKSTWQKLLPYTRRVPLHFYTSALDRAAFVANNSSNPVQTVFVLDSSCYWLCLLVHSAVVSTAPDYLRNMLYPVSERASQRALRSATNNDMVVPRSRLKFGERAFSIAAPRAWNSIPADLCVTLNTATFKKNLKTFLFRESYSSF